MITIKAQRSRLSDSAQTFSQEGTGQDRTGQICLGNNCILPGQAWVQDTEFLLLQMSAHSLALAPALRENRAFLVRLGTFMGMYVLGGVGGGDGREVDSVYL